MTTREAEERTLARDLIIGNLSQEEYDRKMLEIKTKYKGLSILGLSPTQDWKAPGQYKCADDDCGTVFTPKIRDQQHCLVCMELEVKRLGLQIDSLDTGSDYYRNNKQYHKAYRTDRCLALIRLNNQIDQIKDAK